jgi:predicted RNase H-like HicB family nuclease
MSLTIEIDRETDGRWIAEVPELPGCMAYGAERGDAIEKVKALARDVIAQRREHGEPAPDLVFSLSKAA